MTGPRYNLTKLQNKIIAIDGPAGSGKSTTARMLAARLGYSYLDTGAMYRSLTYLAMKRNIMPADSVQLSALARQLAFRFDTHTAVNRVFVNGEDLTEQIRTPEVTQRVSEVSAHKGVREIMVAKQKELGKNGSIVAEGRDTTTTVFPNADVKVYLDASVETRARRRLIDLARINVSTSLDEQIDDLTRRDAFDSGREHSPLQRAHDAYVVDTTSLTVEEQVDRVVALLKRVLT